MDLLSLLTMSSAVASHVSLGVTLLQWIRDARQSRTKLTIDEYLEWLRSQNHNELVELLSNNEEALTGIESLLDEVKDSILQAITDHEFNSAKRHDQVISLLTKAQTLDVPILKIKFKGISTSSESPRFAAYKAGFHVVNASNSHATITQATAILRDRAMLAIEARVMMLYDPPQINVEPHGGSIQMVAVTNKLEPKPTGELTLEYLSLELAQDDHPRCYVPVGESETLEMQLPNQ